MPSDPSLRAAEEWIIKMTNAVRPPKPEGVASLAALLDEARGARPKAEWYWVHERRGGRLVLHEVMGGDSDDGTERVYVMSETDYSALKRGEGSGA